MDDGAIIGVIGTVIGTITGTVLGWVLNSYSQRGKLNLFVYNWNEVLEMSDGYGGFKPSSSQGETTIYTCHFDIDIYNSSSNPRIMRSVRIRYYDNNRELFSLSPRDYSTRHISGGLIHCDDINAINIPGKNINVVHTTSSIGNNNDLLDLLFKSNTVCLTYKNEKDKLIKVKITERNCQNLLECKE